MNQKSVQKKEEQFFLTFPSVSYRVKTGEHFKRVALLADGWSERKKCSIILEGDNTSCDISFFILGSEKNTYPCDVNVDVLGKNSRATISIRSLLADLSVLDLNGRCTIASTAKNANVFFESHTLLLSSYARARTTPSLEVGVDEVKAGHAATIGKIDPEQIFFLQSRGFSKEESITLIARHFFSSKRPDLSEKSTHILEKSLTKFLSKKNQYV